MYRDKTNSRSWEISCQMYFKSLAQVGNHGLETKANGQRFLAVTHSDFLFFFSVAVFIFVIDVACLNLALL